MLDWMVLSPSEVLQVETVLLEKVVKEFVELHLVVIAVAPSEVLVVHL
jgi:hypothetical protein